MMIEKLGEFVQQYFAYASDVAAPTETFLSNIAMETVIAFVVVAAPVMLISMVAAVVATGAQTRFLFTGEGFKPKFNRLNPLQGIKRMFSMRSLIEVLKGIIKFIVIAYIIYNFIIGQVNSYSRMLTLDITQSVVVVLNSIMDLVINVSIIFVFLAAVDYLYQWWDYERQMKMSKQEVKEEYRQTEGDPQIQGQIRERRRKMAMSRMMQAVPTADVIIRNPTHYAVALKYDIDHDRAPIVVAKGVDELALRIVDVGKVNDVFITENVELARAIYAAADVNQEIPFEYYNAVAEVLALVYSVKQKQI